MNVEHTIKLACRICILTLAVVFLVFMSEVANKRSNNIPDECYFRFHLILQVRSIYVGGLAVSAFVKYSIKTFSLHIMFNKTETPVNSIGL